MMNLEAHKAMHKSKGVVAAQEMRRKRTLDGQDRSRQAILDAHRKVMENLSHKVHKQGKLTTKEHTLMLSEWFYRPPEDFAENWMFLVCPVGQRCVVYTHHGRTYAYLKNGYCLKEFQSQLPGGNQGRYADRHSNVVLDCIFAKDVGRFYVLDVLHWRRQPLVDTEFQCRRFMMESNLEEIPGLALTTDFNWHPIIPLNVLSCTHANLEFALFKYPFFPSNQPLVDGVLFYHKEAHYVRGETPLVLWLKAFMLPEMFSIEVAAEHMKERPEKYTNALDFMEEFDRKYAKKKGRKTDVSKKKDRTTDVSMEEVPEELKEPVPTLRDEVMDEEESDDEEERRRKLIAVELEG